MHIPLRFTGSEDGPARFFVPVVFVVMGVGMMVWFYLEGPPVAGWGRFVPYAFGGLFAVVGVGNLIGALRQESERDAAHRALEEHRDTPWRVRPEWRSEELVAETSLDRSSVILAVVWNLFAWPLAFILIRAEQGSGNSAVWLVALFPVIGLGLFGQIVYQLLRARKFGRTVVTLDPMPPRLGRRISGRLRTKIERHVRPEDGFLVKVSCYRQSVRYTRDSDGDRTRRIERDLLWRDETRLREDATLDRTMVEVPFEFRLPEDVPPSTPLKLDNRILWEVSAEADMPGIDFAAEVEVPVFPAEPGSMPEEQDGTAVTAPDVAGAEGASTPTWSFEEPLTEGILLVEEPGLFELHFTAARRRKGAVGWGILGIVLLLAGVLLLPVSGLFGVIVSVMGGVLVYAGVQQATNDTVLRVEGGRIQVTHDGVGMPTDVDFPVGQVEEILVHLGSSSASDDATYTLSVAARAEEGLEHLQVQADKVMGVMSRFGMGENHPAMEAMREGAERPRIQVADGLSDKDEADWLASRVQEAVERERGVAG